MAMKTFSANIKSTLYWTIGFLVAISVFVVFTKSFSLQTLPWLILFDIIYLLFCILKYRLSAAQVNKERQALLLTKSNLLGYKKIESHNLSAIQYAYKQGVTGGRAATKANICTLYESDKTIAKLIPFVDGWDDEEVFAFVYELIYSGVQKKLVGNSQKDVEMKDGF